MFSKDDVLELKFVEDDQRVVSKKSIVILGNVGAGAKIKSFGTVEVYKNVGEKAIIVADKGLSVIGKVGAAARLVTDGQMTISNKVEDAVCIKAGKFLSVSKSIGMCAKIIVEGKANFLGNVGAGTEITCPKVSIRGKSGHSVVIKNPSRRLSKRGDRVKLRLV